MHLCVQMCPCRCPCLCASLRQFASSLKQACCAGLDAHSAWSVLRHLSLLAANGRTLCASLHQPRAAIWDSLHKARLAPAHQAAGPDHAASCCGSSDLVTKHSRACYIIWDLLPQLTWIALQVAILTEGRCVYYGPPDGVVPWFNGSLGYPYDSHTTSESVPDWIIDVVRAAS